MISIKPNSIVLVTGASGGIGSCTSKMFHNMGAHVVISGRNTEKLNQLKDSIGEKCSIEICDLSDLDACLNLIKTIEQKFGRLDVLICNGGGPIKTIEGREMTEEEKQSYSSFSKVMKVNLDSTFILNEEAIKLMKLTVRGYLVWVLNQWTYSLQPVVPINPVLFLCEAYDRFKLITFVYMW